jgi:hypothetical protein
MPAGRPTKYDPAFCDVVIKVGEDGGWVSEMAEACDVHRSTFPEWEREYPEFSASLKRAKQKSQSWFERKARTNLENSGFNSPLWHKQMAARHPDEYSERKQIDHRSGDGTMTPPNTVTLKIIDTAGDE